MSDIRIDKNIYRSAPNDGKRLEKEMRAYELLESLNIEYERVDHDPAGSVEDCRGVEKLLGVEICKNLFLCNSQKNRFYLLMMPGEKVFKTKDLSKQIGSARLSFAGPEFMEAFLDITPGSVSVLGLANDKEKRVRLLIDGDILKNEYIGCHPCINTSSLKIKTSDLTDKLLPYIEHLPTIVNL